MSLRLYKSSAGSGKTFTLVKEYLMLALKNPLRYRNIVAITFTNAAAAEMKDRILKNLQELANGEPTAMSAALLNEGLKPYQLANASFLLEKILHGYSWFQVGTIDSFFHGIIRSFSKELELPSDFEIFIDSDEALDFAVDEFLFNSWQNPEVHTLLVDYVREKISNSQSWNVRGDLMRIAKEILKDHSLTLPETELSAIKEFIATLRKLMRAFENDMDAMAVNIYKKLDEYGLAVEDLKNGKSGVMSFVKKCLKTEKEYEPGKRFIAGLTDIGEWYKKNDPNQRQIEEAYDMALQGMCTALYQKYETDYPEYQTAKEILKNIYTFAVYEELNKALQQYRDDKNVMLVSDFTRILARNIIKEEISFIFSKTGSRYEHFLVDEFQDTSALQWISLRPLIENAISQGNACLIVGDSKQAIYRWRGGRVELIERQVTEIDFPHHSQKHVLSKNYRSRPTIISFNNMFFKKAAELFPYDSAEYELLADIFKDAPQQYDEAAQPVGYAKMDFIAVQGRLRENFLEPARAAFMQHLHDCRQAHYKWKDMAVLVRDKRDAGDIAALLHHEGIPFITQDSLNLDHSPVIRLMLCLLKFVINPNDTLSKTEVLFLHREYIAMQDDGDAGDFFQDWLSRKNLLNDAFPAGFLENITHYQALPLYNLAEELVNLFGLNRDDAYLQRFMDAVLEYVIKERGTAAGFLEWWEDGKFTVILPENQDAVQIMTIHKSKGLEFPVVFIPFADWDFGSSRPEIIWVEPETAPFNTFPSLPVNFGSGLKNSLFAADYQREEALTVIDNLNLLYVAFTRAKNRLYVNTPQPGKTVPDSIKSIPQLIHTILQPNLKEGISMLHFGNENEA